MYADSMRQHSLADDPRPAPGRLALIQDLANAHFAEAPQPERERAPEAVAAWLQRHRLARRGYRPAPAEVARLIDLRDAIRALLAANARGSRPPASAVRALNAAAAASPLHVSFTAGVSGVAPAARGSAVATIVAIIAEAMREGAWSRLKICASDDCGWAFYDSSRNRSGAWCSMASCGNRAKARAYRARHRR